MKAADILQTFHSMPASDRLDMICRMLRHCVPFELRFLGTIVCDTAREQYKSFVKAEVSANRVNYFSGFKDTGLTHEVCEKLCCALAVVHADNHPVAETVFSLLNDLRVLNFFEDTTDVKVLEDFRLLYVMAVNHPALSFNQRQHLMYTYLHRMDSVFSEKCKYNFSGSFSSMEKTLSGEMEGGKYLPEGFIREPAPDAYITRCEVHSVYKRATDRRYVYMIQVEWSDGTLYTVRRTYGDFFSFQTKLLDLFPEEGGQKGKKHPRLIPYLPGKNIKILNKSNRDMAEKRLPELARYARDLVSLPERIARSSHLLEFLKPRPADLSEEYPPLHKITNLYDLLESGKRHTHLSEPIRSASSPTHSPIPIRGHRLFGSGNDSPSSSPRMPHTLPHSIPSSVQPEKEEDSPVIPRRPTYPLSNRLKGEKSAFKPVVASNNDSTTTLVSASSLQPQSSASTTAFSASFSTPPCTVSTTPSSVATATASSSITTTSLVQSAHPVTSEHHKDATLTHSTAIFNTHSKTQLVTSECNSLVRSKAGTIPTPTTSRGLCSPDGTSTAQSTQQNATLTRANAQVMAKTTSVLTNPTSSVTSPLFTPATVTQSHASQMAAVTTPPPSGKSTPRQVYSPSVSQLMYGQHGPSMGVQPFSPVPAFWYPGSPLPSPTPSPKTPKVNKMYASAMCVNRTPPTEYDSLLKWLKSHRLHKYHKLFESMTFEELCALTEEQLKEKNMTAGAAKKLCLKLEELRRANFSGFRDMPLTAGLVRKPSTCSLPAALLVEKGITPSSSYEGLSPASSTCSLDMINQRGNTSARLHRSSVSETERRYSKNESSMVENSPVLTNVDAAIVKAVPLLPHTKMNGEVSDVSTSSEVPPRGRSGMVSPQNPATVPKVRNKCSDISDSSSARASARSSGGTSWADQVVPCEESAVINRPEWAHMTANGEVKHNTSVQSIGNQVLSSFPQVAGSHSIQGLHAQFHPNTPPHIRHNAATKRSSTDVPNSSIVQVSSTPESSNKHTRRESSSSPVIKVPQPVLPSSSIPGSARSSHLPMNATNWQGAPMRQFLLPNSVSLVRTSRPQVTPPTAVYASYTTSATVVNGLVSTPPSQPINRVPAVPPPHHHAFAAGGFVSYPTVGLPMHSQSSSPAPPPTCFNCGKRGHLGSTCPGETMESNNAEGGGRACQPALLQPGAFHKRVEKLART